MSLKMIKLKLSLLIIGIFLSVSIRSPTFAFSNLNNENLVLEQINDPIIINFGHTPILPFPNQVITIFATLSYSSISITNVTLVYQLNQSSIFRVEMSSVNNIQYEFDLPGQFANTMVFYKIELYVNNQLSDQRPSDNFAEISIDNEISNQEIVINPGNMVSLNPAEYIITNKDKTLEIHLNISKPIEFTYNITERLKVLSLNNHIQLTDKVSIEINDSEALGESQLLMNYDQSLIDEFGAIESSLQLLTRENTSTEWEEYPSLVDEINNKVIANVSHFSEWIVASPNSVLRLLQVDNPNIVALGSIIGITSIGSNVGNIRADNISLSIFLPNGLILNNKSSIYSIDNLYPLENISIVWNFFADTIGIYTVVLVLGSSNAQEDIVEIQFEVSDSIDSSSNSETIISSSSDSSKSPLILPLTSIMISLTLLWLKKRKNRFK